MSAHHLAERTLIARVAAHAKHAKHDPVAGTAKARQTFRDQFVQQAREQYGDLPESELARRAEHLRKAHFTRLALRSAQARRSRQGAQ